MSAFGAVVSWLSHLVFPPVCAGCGRRSLPGACLCSGCREAALAETVHPPPPPGVEAIACGPRLDGCVRSLVHGLKYHGHRRAARDLVEIARASTPDDFCPSGAVLVAVPVHPHRRRERGYNQSDELARHWSRILSVPVEPDALRRVVDTATQTRLDAARRRENLDGVFRVGDGFQSDRPVVLVDDVLTTGATLSSCAATLLSAGCPSVRALCAAWAGEA